MEMERGKQFEMNERFDSESCRHYLNDSSVVLHSHHYATLFTELADDAVDFQGVHHLKRAAEETFYEIIQDYFNQHGVQSMEDKAAIGCDYWRKIGMGQIAFKSVGKHSLTVEMIHSHVDQGWIEKCGKRPNPVNFITQGFVAAMAAHLLNKATRSFSVREIKSLVSGDNVSIFKAVAE